MAAPGKGRTVAIVLLVIFLAIGVFFFNSLGKSTPEGVDADAITLRSVTLSGDNYEVVTIEEELYELPSTARPRTRLLREAAISCRATAMSCGSRAIRSSAWASKALT